MPGLSFISRYLNDKRPWDRSLILMYHGTVPKGRRVVSRYSVSAERFLEKMDFIKAGGWRTGTIGELADHGANPPGNTVYITFDDGFSDHYQGAFVPLRERGMKATWFIVSGLLGKMSDWVDGDGGNGELMVGEQIRELSDAGMEIGSHSMTHKPLESLDGNALEKEVVGSKAQLEDLLGKPVRSFAYPFGTYDEAVVRAVEKAGYASACIVNSGWHNPAESPLLLRRVTVYADDTQDSFARKLAFAANSVETSDILGYFFGRLRAKFGGH